ncbi:MAG: adenylyltransferase/cytidyltransferase family protein [Magnetococcales bacterium]|nr:adenylyltransferase/cytidyltransferase family protein [Magnetococcales bacterium]
MDPASKIVTLEQLSIIADGCRSDGRSVVLCHGGFDLLHPGHIRHLQRARAEGDVLLVSITADAYINKGPGRPVFSHTLRADSLAALSFVDYVTIIYDATALPAIQALKPSVYAKGNDYSQSSQDLTGNINLEREAVEANGGRIFFTNEVTFSSSNLLNTYFDVFSADTRRYLTEFGHTHTSEQLINQLRQLSPMRVLVVGEAIIDEYCYTTPLGQTGKSGNILSVRYDGSELFAGGALAVANHLAGFVENVTLVTALGRPPDNHEPFIRSQLLPNVTPILRYFSSTPTIVKRRYVDGDINKFFEVYFYDDRTALTDALDLDLSQWIRDNAADYDLVVVPDYGNGMIFADQIKALCDTARFLAVNTQINSGNRGYHVITRYPRADFVSLNENEVRLADHNRHAPLEEVAAKIAAVVGAKQMAVTLGTQGAIMLDRERNASYRASVLSSRVVDRIGAGDAFLAIASLCLAGGMPADAALFLGSTAAALDVQVVCNRETISPVNLFKYVTTLLK